MSAEGGEQSPRKCPHCQGVRAEGYTCPRCNDTGLITDPRDPKAVENKVKDRYAVGGEKWIAATDANYGNPFWIRVHDISALTIVAENTYREGQIPNGVFRRTLIYTKGGNQFAVRETPDAIMEVICR
jgi:hypothetical protein